MPRTRHLLDALRVAALWLLMGAVLFGPAGLGGSAAFASGASTCGASCPCEDAAHDERAEEHADHAGEDPQDDGAGADSEHGDGEPCEDECPDDCPDCG
ncbi:MAG: hypothetical protein OEY14_10735, partial [Myxococcales bacterium]|nr:hypothetical protein [Myxococcales bacterium]